MDSDNSSSYYVINAQKNNHGYAMPNFVAAEYSDTARQTYDYLRRITVSSHNQLVPASGKASAIEYSVPLAFDMDNSSEYYEDLSINTDSSYALLNSIQSSEHSYHRPTGDQTSGKSENFSTASGKIVYNQDISYRVKPNTSDISKTDDITLRIPIYSEPVRRSTLTHIEKPHNKTNAMVMINTRILNPVFDDAESAL